MLRTGLSWPNLSTALESSSHKSTGFAVLYLGQAATDRNISSNQLVAVDRHGVLLTDQAEPLAQISGLILLDGTWSQAKALWWRNPWLLKCQRLVLLPVSPSRYGRLRQQPRPEALSTLEAAALALSLLEKQPAIQETLLAPFTLMLSKASNAASSLPPRRPNLDRRRFRQK